jgi:hypothetical protein
MEVAMDSNDLRYSDGLVKLRTLKALFNNLKDVPPLENVIAPIKAQPSTRETGLLEKCRNRALDEFNDHQKRAEAFHLLSDRYRALGLNDQADAYRDQSHLERATTRGFESVLKAYEKKLENAHFRGIVSEEPKGDLERAGQYLESYNSDRKSLEENTLRVLKAGQIIQRLNAELANRPFTPAENQQFEAAAGERDRSIRMAECNAGNAALSYRGFQAETQAAAKHYDSLSHSSQADLEKTGTDDRGPGSGRMNKLALGVVVYQTLKVLDHEL